MGLFSSFIFFMTNNFVFVMNIFIFVRFRSMYSMDVSSEFVNMLFVDIFNYDFSWCRYFNFKICFWSYFYWMRIIYV